MLNGLSEARAGRAGLVRAGRWAGSWREYNQMRTSVSKQWVGERVSNKQSEV